MKGNESTEQNYYSVSEAVQRSGVPSHVLRYWEDELRLPIRRTAQGHRIYSEMDIETFRRVKELKDKGIQLKAIRLLLIDSGGTLQLGQLFGEDTGLQPASRIADDAREKSENENICQEVNETEYEIIPVSESGNYQRFETLLRSLVSEAVAEQNQKLEQELAELIRDELEDLCLQLRQEEIKREAAVTKEGANADYEKTGLLPRIRNMLFHRTSKI